MTMTVSDTRVNQFPITFTHEFCLSNHPFSSRRLSLLWQHNESTPGVQSRALSFMITRYSLSFPWPLRLFYSRICAKTFASKLHITTFNMFTMFQQGKKISTTQEGKGNAKRQTSDASLTPRHPLPAPLVTPSLSPLSPPPFPSPRHFLHLRTQAKITRFGIFETKVLRTDGRTDRLLEMLGRI